MELKLSWRRRKKQKKDKTGKLLFVFISFEPIYTLI